MANNRRGIGRRGFTPLERATVKEMGDVDITAGSGPIPPSVQFIRGPRSLTGFTLLEIMIAVAVIGGLLVSLISSLNYHLGIAERHEFVTVASLLAKDKLAEVEKNPATQKGEFPDPYSDYHFASEIKESSYPGISEITVTVSRGDETVKLSDLIEKMK
jgi:general secretion pathway protein I